jgi:hypothetical protein
MKLRDSDESQADSLVTSVNDDPGMGTLDGHVNGHLATASMLIPSLPLI